jgi:hypothetical protein
MRWPAPRCWPTEFWPAPPWPVSDRSVLRGWTSWRGRENQEEFGAALAGPAGLQAYLEQEAQGFAGVTGEQVAAALGDLVSAVDVAALTGDFASYVAASFRQALANGIWGWFDDDLAFTRPGPGGSTWIVSACRWSSGRAGRTGWSRSPTASGWRLTF